MVVSTEIYGTLGYISSAAEVSLIKVPWCMFGCLNPVLFEIHRQQPDCVVKVIILGILIHTQLFLLFLCVVVLQFLWYLLSLVFRV